MRLLDLTRSTSFHVATSYALLFALSVAVLFAFVFWESSIELTEQLRADVQRDTDDLLALYRTSGIEELQNQIVARTRQGDPDATIYALRDAENRMLVGNAALSGYAEGWAESKPGTPGLGVAEFAAGGNFMLLGTRVGDGLLLVGQSRDTIEDIREVLSKSFLTGSAITVLLALLGGLTMSLSGSRRFDAVTSAINEIMGGNLNRRLPVVVVRDDFDRLVSAINRMLDRIQSLMENLAQVSNDIAHDLRTPLGRLRQNLERARTRPQEYEAAIDHSIVELDAILETFTALLRIAQIESGERRSCFAPFDLSRVARSIVESFEAVAESQNQRLTGHVAPNVTLFGDRELITQALVNMVENAIRHSPASTRIAVDLSCANGRAALTVSDTGPGIPVDERGKVLRRLYRVDSSRSTPGNGLGLALIKAVADLHRAELLLSDNAPGLRISLRLPDRDRA